MSILASEVLTKVNEVLFPGQTGIASIDEPLRDTLKDISPGAVLETTATLTMSDSADYVAQPTDMILAQSIQAEDYAPLLLIDWSRYLDWMGEDDARDIPEYYVVQAKRIYTYRPCSTAGAALTWTIAYQYLHPDAVTSILFDEEYRECIYDGVLWRVARDKQKYDELKLYKALFDDQLAIRRAHAPSHAGFVAYYDLGG